MWNMSLSFPVELNQMSLPSPEDIHCVRESRAKALKLVELKIGICFRLSTALSFAVGTRLRGGRQKSEAE